jgi:hypothetical protein
LIAAKPSEQFYTDASRLQKRSFGLVMLLLALVGLLPAAGIFIGILLAFPAVQMILGRETPTLPHFLSTRRIATRHIAWLATRTIPLVRRMEALIRPRRTPRNLARASCYRRRRSSSGKTGVRPRSTTINCAISERFPPTVVWMMIIQRVSSLVFCT